MVMRTCQAYPHHHALSGPLALSLVLTELVEKLVVYYKRKRNIHSNVRLLAGIKRR
jgi:hypothetical protein